jgi:hypothetical protein
MIMVRKKEIKGELQNTFLKKFKKQNKKKLFDF